MSGQNYFKKSIHDSDINTTIKIMEKKNKELYLNFLFGTKTDCYLTFLTLSN